MLPQNGFSNFVNVPNKFAVPSAIDKTTLSWFSWRYNFLRIESSSVDFWARTISWFLNVRNQKESPFQISLTTNTSISEEYCWDLFTNLVEPWMVFRRSRNIFNQWSEKKDGSFRMVLQIAFHEDVFPSVKKTLTFRSHSIRIRPPFLIQTILEQYCRCFLYCAHHSFSHTTRLGSIKWMLNDDAMKKYW